MLRITFFVAVCLRPFVGRYFASWKTGHSQLWNWGRGVSHLFFPTSQCLTQCCFLYVSIFTCEILSDNCLQNWDFLCSVSPRLQTTFRSSSVEKHALLVLVNDQWLSRCFLKVTVLLSSCWVHAQAKYLKAVFSFQKDVVIVQMIFAAEQTHYTYVWWSLTWWRSA